MARASGCSGTPSSGCTAAAWSVGRLGERSSSISGLSSFLVGWGGGRQNSGSLGWGSSWCPCHPSQNVGGMDGHHHDVLGWPQGVVDGLDGGWDKVGL